MKVLEEKVLQELIPSRVEKQGEVVIIIGKIMMMTIATAAGYVY